MKHRSVTRHVPWTAGQMFDLAVDIEHYPEFLPAWRAARILRREAGVLYVSQEIDLGIRRLVFESRAVLEAPQHLHISSVAGPFRRLEIDWRFTPQAQGGCGVTLTVSLEMYSQLLEVVSGRLMELLTRDTFERFRARAAQLYGG